MTESVSRRASTRRFCSLQ
uniref:Uncharacterized protein n=1 Tax=Arundo donax TaxID=35708 RepID=A0A0A9SKJ5_ARUDO